MERFLARLAVNSAAIVIAVAGLCVVLVFLLIAFYLGMSEIMAPWAAALSTAGAALLFSILVLVIARLITRSAIPKEETERHRSSAELGEMLGRRAHMFVSTNSPILLGILTALGFALGFSPRLRKFLMKLL